MAYIAFVNFNKITSSIESLSKSKNETTIIKQIDSGILEIRTSSEILSNTFKIDDYDKYKKNIQHTQQLIDRLQLELMEKEINPKLILYTICLPSMSILLMNG